jgi:nitroimidazol reductase NimA-like FMN-containing flavoprotein (pyridoxamine 5'-phosphate oxidase superfamily)
VRRRDKEIADRAEIDAVISNALVCRLAFADGNKPYVVPISFGYDGEALYVHTAKKGRKIDFIDANNRVCFEFETGVELRTDPNDACAWTFSFESVIGYGRVTEIEDPEEKARGLNQIVRHYSRREWQIDLPAVATTRVWRIAIESVTGKRSVEEKPADPPLSS